MLNKPQQKYHSLLILLHWVMAFAFAVMFVSSEVMEESPNDLAFILHSSLGLSLLLLFIFRFCISIFSRKTINHTQFAKWEQLAFKIIKLGFYVLMFLTPLTGWLMTHFEPEVQPSQLWNIVPWPMLFSPEASHEQFEVLEEIHEFCANSLILLIFLHIGAFLKHRLIDDVDLLKNITFRN
jgi:cytochrome b561